MIGGCFDYFYSSGLRSLPNMCCIFALVFIWIALSLLSYFNSLEFRYDEDLILFDRHEL